MNSRSNCALLPGSVSASSAILNAAQRSKVTSGEPQIGDGLVVAGFASIISRSGTMADISIANFDLSQDRRPEYANHPSVPMAPPAGVPRFF